jgi:exodeoxyribonuclease VII large subunit
MSDTATNAQIYTVSDITGAVKRTLEADFAHVRVRGEVSKATYNASGHVYFTIKDENTSIDAVIWKGVIGRVKHKPQLGDDIILTGKLSTSPFKSTYQIIATECELAGLGALLAQLERLKGTLAAEGLFNPARKQLLPTTPRVIGVITSPTGAVIRDILHRIRDRWPCRIVVWPVAVQGDGAAAQIRAAIMGFNALPANGAIPRPDVLIVARGGGSVEDLWAFNDEALVRAAAASDIPLISAVGHETDTTLIDFAADVRAPTPTAAAEIVTPVRAEVDAILADRQARLGLALNRMLEGARTAIRAIARALPKPEDLLGLKRQRLDHVGAQLQSALATGIARHQHRMAQIGSRLSPHLIRSSVRQQSERLGARTQRLHMAMPGLLSRARDRLAARGQMLELLSYKNTLARGFAVIHGPKGLIRSTADLKPGTRVEIELADGKTPARTEGTQGLLL